MGSREAGNEKAVEWAAGEVVVNATAGSASASTSRSTP
jgi:hypothetical protein